VRLPPLPGHGSYPLTLATPAFYVLLALLGLFALMLGYLWKSHPTHKRGFEGYYEAAGISLTFLTFSVLLVIGTVLRDPSANRTSWALYEVILSGYWLTFAIPIVTVASSVESRSRGRIPWVVPSVVVAVAMFAALFGYYFYGI
jgi:hypothetical protein